MAYDVKIVQVNPQLLAVARDRTTLAELPTKFIQRITDVWDFLHDPSTTVKSDGHNIVVYFDEDDNELLMIGAGVPIEAGARVLTPFTLLR